MVSLNITSGSKIHLYKLHPTLVLLRNHRIRPTIVVVLATMVGVFPFYVAYCAGVTYGCKLVEEGKMALSFVVVNGHLPEVYWQL